MRYLTSSVLVCLLACSGAQTDNTPRDSTPPPPPEPVGEPVSLFELIPAAANGAAMVDVTRLRTSSHGPALTNMVRRLGVYRWEDAVGVDLRTQVGRLLVFGVASEEHGPGDLSQVIDSLRQSNLGVVVELSEDAIEGDGVCRGGELWSHLLTAK